MDNAAVAVAAVTPLVLGVLVVVRSERRALGWLLVAHGVSVALLLGRSSSWEQGDATPGDLGRAGLVADQLLAGAWVFLFLWLVLVVHLLPDGRPGSRRWRAVLVAGVAGAALLVVGAAGDRTGFAERHGGASAPLPWLPEWLSGALGATGLALTAALVFLSPVVVRSRWATADEQGRDQLLWVAWGALSVPLGLAVLWANHVWLGDDDAVTAAVLAGISVAVPASIAIAVVRHGLLDIRVVLGRTLTYGILLLAVSLLYAALLLATRRLVGDATVGGWLAVTVVAVAVHPAYVWLREHLERRVHGYRSQPHRALRLLADRVERAEVTRTVDGDGPAGGPSGDLTGVITEVVVEVLRAEAAWIADVDDADEEVVARPGTVRTPMVHRGERLGDLVIAVAPGARLTPRDERLLHDLARYAAVLVHAERQSRRLSASRARIVAGREEERRRLRNDLHDEVGPTLAAVVLQLDAAQSRNDDRARAAHLQEARAGVRDAIAELRRAVDDLRPPALDEVGLVGAIRHRAAALALGLEIEVTGPDPLPVLPAAIEVAAFRIASEAMLNVVRHARATRCHVDLQVADACVLTVSDDGRGHVRDASRDASRDGGLGWTSMRERAAEVGGTCQVSARPGGGVVVRAELPVRDHVAVPLTRSSA
ncbi:sensor histidine kinase [uncultured Nocardioides sp.]|uniref:sensor histidine kinase n=1 Tax=Nocardioides sp. T5 TaxID=3400182 RepID=UPI002607B069|nr:sensor histidine kinase [uncultured Nocardioides sp.]